MTAQCSCYYQHRVSVLCFCSNTTNSNAELFRCIFFLRRHFFLNSVYFVQPNITNYKFASEGFTIFTYTTSLSQDLTSDQESVCLSGNLYKIFKKYHFDSRRWTSLKNTVQLAHSLQYTTSDWCFKCNEELIRDSGPLNWVTCIQKKCEEFTGRESQMELLQCSERKEEKSTGVRSRHVLWEVTGRRESWKPPPK